MLFRNNSKIWDRKVAIKLSSRISSPADLKFRSKMNENFKLPEE